MRVSPAAAWWWVHGERGVSSETIFDWLVWGEVRRFAHHPLDPDDFRRCELLLRAVPELRGRLSEMATVSPEWAGLVERWDEIAALIEEEAPGIYEGDRSSRAPKSYALMRSIERAAA